MQKRLIVPLVVMCVFILGIGFFDVVLLAPVNGYFDCGGTVMDLDISTTAISGFPVVDKKTIGFDLKPDEGKKYGQADGDGNIDGGYSVTKKGNSLRLYAGANDAHNNAVSFTITITPGQSPTASITGTIGNSNIGGSTSGISGVSVTGSGTSTSPYTISFDQNGNTITITWSC